MLTKMYRFAKPFGGTISKTRFGTYGVNNINMSINRCFSSIKMDLSKGIVIDGGTDGNKSTILGLQNYVEFRKYIFEHGFDRHFFTNHLEILQNAIRNGDNITIEQIHKWIFKHYPLSQYVMDNSQYLLQIVHSIFITKNVQAYEMFEPIIDSSYNLALPLPLVEYLKYSITLKDAYFRNAPTPDINGVDLTLMAMALEYDDDELYMRNEKKNTKYDITAFNGGIHRYIFHTMIYKNKLDFFDAYRMKSDYISLNGLDFNKITNSKTLVHLLAEFKNNRKQMDNIMTQINTTTDPNIKIQHIDTYETYFANNKQAIDERMFNEKLIASITYHH